MIGRDEKGIILNMTNITKNGCYKKFPLPNKSGCSNKLCVASIDSIRAGKQSEWCQSMDPRFNRLIHDYVLPQHFTRCSALCNFNLSVPKKGVYVWTSCKRWWNVSLSILQLNFPLPVPQVEICKCVSVLSILAEETNTHSTKLTLQPFSTIISREMRPQHLTMSS